MFKFKELGLAAIVGAGSFTATTTGINVYADGVTKSESLAKLQEVTYSFNDDAFVQEYEEGKTYDALYAVAAGTNGYTQSVTADRDIDLSRLGTTTVKYTFAVTDWFKQTVETEVEKTFTVKDTKAPSIKFSAKEVSFTEGEDFDPMKNIKSITDNYDGEITDNDKLVTVESDVKADAAGSYTVKVTAKDTSGNSSEKEYAVTVNKKVVYVAPSYSSSGNVSSSYTGSTGYQAASGSSWSAPVQQAAPSMGSAGRIYMGGYTAALNAGSLWDAGGTQNIINAQDSAFYDASMNYIADHAAQGFRFGVGSQLTWNTGAGSRTYTCTRVMYGDRSSWTCSEGFDVLDNAGGQLITQTCTGNGIMWGYWN